MAERVGKGLTHQRQSSTVEPRCHGIRAVECTSVCPSAEAIAFRLLAGQLLVPRPHEESRYAVTVAPVPNRSYLAAATSRVRPSSSSTPILRASVSAKRWWAWAQSSSSSWTRSSAPARCAGRVGERGEEFVEDAQAGFLPAVLDDHLAHHVFEAGRAEAVAAGQVAAVTVDDHRQCGDPGLLSGTVAARCPARPASRIREDRASADLTRRPGHQLFAAMPRCRSRAEVSSTGSGSYLKYRGGQSLLLGGRRQPVGSQRRGWRRPGS